MSLKIKSLWSSTYFEQGSRFAIVGVLNGIIGLGTIYAAYNIFHINYKLSNILGYTLGLINSFILNKKWTFKSKRDPRLEILLFLVMFGVSYTLNLVSVIFCVERLKLNPNIAQIVGIFFYTTSNFFGNKLITFRS